MTSNGDFETTKVGNGNIDMKFTEFSCNKVFSVESGIVMLDENAPNPTFDMILGVENLRNFRVILNFAEITITIDYHVVIMRPLGAFSNIRMQRHALKREVRNTQQGTFFPGAPPDPAAVAEATDRTMGILDASYEKVDLPKVICENCSYLSSSEKTKLLKLLQKHEESFEGSLGDFQTDLVRFDLKL